MTSKHFIKMASILFERQAECQTEDERVVVRLIASDFCNMAKSDNANFDRARFIKACGF